MNSAVWNLAVFARRGGRRLFWRTLGLGSFNVDGRGAPCHHRPRRSREGAGSAASRRSRPPGSPGAGRRPAVDLVKVHLDLRFAQPDNVHLSGQAPLVVERLPRGDRRRPDRLFAAAPGRFLRGRPEGGPGPPGQPFLRDRLGRPRAEDGPALLFHRHDRLQLVPAKISWPELEARKSAEPALDRRRPAGARARCSRPWRSTSAGELAADEERLAGAAAAARRSRSGSSAGWRRRRGRRWPSSVRPAAASRA